MATSTLEVNGALIYILVFSFLILFAVVFLLTYFAVKYRSSRHPVATEIPGNRLLEALWILVPTLLALSMFAYGLTGFRFLRNAPSDAIAIKVHARQWSWLFEYENGKKSPDLVVPLGVNVKCLLDSADVIHGFYVPAFRIQEDAVPGIVTQVWFKALTTGTYDVLCSLYCGLEHSAMLAKLIVVPPEDYREWLAGREIELPGRVESPALPEGQRLLLERGCLSCHSTEGGTMTGPTLKGLYGSNVRVRSGGKLFTLIADAEYCRRSIIDPGADIVDGFSDVMPSAKNILSEEEIEKIIDYLEELR